MKPISDRHADDQNFPIRFREFVALMAALMALNSLSTDAMLPALPAIGDALGVINANDRQAIITAFLLGGGIGSLFYGSLSDRYGRRRVVLICLTLLIAITIFCALAQSFALFIAARFTAGFLAAAMRVLTVSIVRDRFAGDRMASIMSLIATIFIIVPVLAPGVGQLVLLVVDWRWIFGLLAAASIIVLIWVAIRLPETLAPENRVAIDARELGATLRRVVTHRQAFAYMIATGVLLSTLIAFVTTAQQLFTDTFPTGAAFPLVFAGMSSAVTVGLFLNQRLVQRVGARRLAHGALVAFILFSLIQIFIIAMGWETMTSFLVMQTASMLCFSFSNSNLSAISMEPFAKGAGMAASFQAFLTSLISTLFGAALASRFDGSTLPLILGSLGFSTVALAIIAWAEKGRLFGPSVPSAAA